MTKFTRLIWGYYLRHRIVFVIVGLGELVIGSLCAIAAVAVKHRSLATYSSQVVIALFWLAVGCSFIGVFLREAAWTGDSVERKAGLAEVDAARSGWHYRLSSLANLAAIVIALEFGVALVLGLVCGVLLAAFGPNDSLWFCKVATIMLGILVYAGVFYLLPDLLRWAGRQIRWLAGGAHGSVAVSSQAQNGEHDRVNVPDSETDAFDELVKRFKES